MNPSVSHVKCRLFGGKQIVFILLQLLWYITICLVTTDTRATSHFWEMLSVKRPIFFDVSAHKHLRSKTVLTLGFPPQEMFGFLVKKKKKLDSLKLHRILFAIVGTRGTNLSNNYFNYVHLIFFRH